jgi:hypothetical protein
MAEKPVVFRSPAICTATRNTSVEPAGNGHFAVRLVGVVDALPEFERSGAYVSGAPVATSSSAC